MSPTSTSTSGSLLSACLLCLSLLCLVVSALGGASIHYGDICGDNFYGGLEIHTTGWAEHRLWDVYFSLCGWATPCSPSMACAIMRKLPGQNVTDAHKYLIASRSSSLPYTWIALADGILITANGNFGECPYKDSNPTTFIQVLCGGSLVVPTPRTDQVAIDPQSCTFNMTVYHPLGCVWADHTTPIEESSSNDSTQTAIGLGVALAVVLSTLLVVAVIYGAKRACCSSGRQSNDSAYVRMLDSSGPCSAPAPLHGQDVTSARV